MTEQKLITFEHLQHIVSQAREWKRMNRVPGYTHELWDNLRSLPEAQPFRDCPTCKHKDESGRDSNSNCWDCGAERHNWEPPAQPCQSVTVKTHPVMEAVACKLFGIEGVPKAEQRRMVNRAAKTAAKMYDDLEQRLKSTVRNADALNDVCKIREQQLAAKSAELVTERRHKDEANRYLEMRQRERDEVRRQRDSWEEAESDLHEELGRRYEDIGTLKKEQAELVALLRLTEWAYDGDYQDYWCNWCNSWKSKGHAADCKLAAALARQDCKTTEEGEAK